MQLPAAAQPHRPALCTTGQVNTIWNEAFTSGIGAGRWQQLPVHHADRLDGGDATHALTGQRRPDCVCDRSPGRQLLRRRRRLLRRDGDDQPGDHGSGGITTARLTFNHWIASEAGWDGGNLKISVNGGAFTLVPLAAYTFNVPNRNLQTAGAGNTNPLAGQRAWSGSDGGSVSGSWGQTQVNLASAGVAPGNTIRLRYDFGMDGCGGLVGWYVDDVNVYACEGRQPR